jgi:hypothetical protein
VRGLEGATVVWATDNSTAYFAAKHGMSRSNTVSNELSFIVDNFRYVAQVPTNDMPADELSRGDTLVMEKLSRAACMDAWRPSLSVEWVWESRTCR